MLETLLKCATIIFIVKLVLEHNLFVQYLKIKLDKQGLNIEVRSKEKSAPSDKE